MEMQIREVLLGMVEIELITAERLPWYRKRGNKEWNILRICTGDKKKRTR
jgi:hypothetical protein